MKNQIVGHEKTEADMDCGGKRSATPLSNPSTQLADHAKALSPLRSASALHNPSVPSGARGATRPTTSERPKLVAMLDHYGLAVAGFDALRKDAYEKQVAAESLEGLERVYEALLDPALGFKEVRERCPVWPEGSRQAGKLPSMMTLREVKERILLEWSVRDRVQHSGFLKQLQAVGLDGEGLMDAMGILLGDELFSAKLDGKPIMENLRVFDRLLRVVGVQLRLRREKRRDAENAERGNEAPRSNIQAPEKHQASNSDVNREGLAVGHLEQATGKSPEPAGSPAGAGCPTLLPMIGGCSRPTSGTNEVILATGYEALDWLPGIKDRSLESLVGMVMGGAKGKAKG